MERGVGKLVWQVNGREIEILTHLPFALLNAKKQELLRQSDYKKGKLVIKYLFK